MIRRHTTAPLAVGEVFDAVCDANPLICEQLIDYPRMTVVRSGGITPAREDCGFCRPVSGANRVRRHRSFAADHGAALPFDISVSNFEIQEYMRHTEETDRVFPHAYSFRDGSSHPGTSWGLAWISMRNWQPRFPRDERTCMNERTWR